VAWAASGALAVDPGTSLADLVELAWADLGPVTVLPAGPPTGSVLARRPTADTSVAVATAGLSCVR
jgi:hypothetical protein